MAPKSYWKERYQRMFITIPYHGLIITAIGCNLLSLYLLFFTNYWYLPLLYLVWMFVDRNSGETGSRGFVCLRKNLPLPEYPFFFKTSSPYQLDPNRNYLFCCYPHGALPFGILHPFLFEKGGFKEVFPNHNPYLTTMQGSYFFPFFRELILAFNCCSASEKSLNYLLDDAKSGNVVALILGGSDEVVHIHKKDYHIVLKKRKGFARLALKNGAPVVPVFSFGVNRVYNYPQGRFQRFLEWFESVTGVKIPVSYGQGVFHNWYGLTPIIKPIYTIVGEPIDVVKNSNPTREQVEELHEKYTTALIKLFDDHKHKYEPDDVKLIIV